MIKACLVLKHLVNTDNKERETDASTAVLNGPIRLGKGCGLDPQFRGVATSTLTLNSLYKVKLLTLLTQSLPAS